MPTRDVDDAAAAEVRSAPPPAPAEAHETADESPYTDPNRNWVNQELELLISAAITFSLFQVPGLLDAAFTRLDLHVSSELGMVIFFPYYISKLVVYGLIATFAAHFLVRSLWVALLGLQASFPRGIQWDRLKLGPVAMELYRDLPTVKSLEKKVDRFASSLFAFLFVFMSMMLTAIISAVGCGVLAYFLARAAGAEDLRGAMGRIFTGLMCLFFVITAGSTFLDRALAGKHGHRIPGWVRKVIAGAYKVVGLLVPKRLYLPIFFTLSSSGLSRRRLTLLLVAFCYSLIAVFMVGLMWDRGNLLLDSYSYYPDETGRWGMVPAHYDSLRPEGRPAAVPSLSAEVAEGAYLRLFLPYDSREDNQRIAAHCPQLEPLHAEGLRRRNEDAPGDDRFEAVLGCLGKVYRLTLDGEEMRGIDWTFYTHPAGDIRGWAAYLPTADLPPGKHLLIVEHEPLPGAAREEAEGESEGDGDDSRDVHYLPFWR